MIVMTEALISNLDISAPKMATMFDQDGSIYFREG